ncbi:uncharacterized protein LOC121855814 isoform X1 [Homarus americanus]|uniref:uncharacterized protein LOC121855814 isoform X1 n=1 Tax=Homarus americanus TaxID=6706 RepID=UPI001C48FA3E|nr:uncharacterized protein LOC121855814 isoform X1 [Homarus americanus]
MNSERAGIGSEPPQLPGPHQLPPHQLLGLAGLVAGAGMGSNVGNNMNMTMHNPMTTDNSASPSPSTVPRSLPVTPTSSSVSGLMTGVGGPSRPPPLPQALLNMDGGAGMPWGGWADLQDSMGMERGRSRNWTYEETVELISMYTSDEWQTKFSSEKKNHRAIWASLAAALSRRKDVSGDEARQRLNNLKALYNRTRRQLLAGEISSPQWEYWEPLHAFLGRPQPYIPITSTPTQSRPPPLHGFQQTQYHQPHAHTSTHTHHQGLLGALGFPQHMPQPRDTPPRPIMKPSPEVKFDNSQREGLAAPEDHGSSDFSHNNGDEVPVAVSPELFLAESNERESTPAPPTPTPQKPESYQLRHNNHLTIVLEALARDESFMDVTLTAQGRSLKAHKSVLSAVSPYFRGVLRDNPCQHPIIIMPRDVRFEELFSIVNYIYKGEMTVAAEDLTSLLKTAEILQVSGLAPSDSSATVNPHTESSTAGNARSSSASSSSSSSNLPSVSKTSRMVKTSTQQTTTPPARPKSRDSMINPTDFMDVDMTCVKEEVQSADEEESEEQVTKESSSQPPGGGMKGDQTLQHSLTTFSPSFDPDLEQPTASTSSSQDISPTTLPIKSDPETEINPLGTVGTEDPHPFMCPHCQEHHRDMDTMITHLRVRHPTKPSFTCGCGRVYTRQMLHQAHARMCSSLS